MSEIAFRGLKNLEISETTARGSNKIFAHFAPARLGRKCSCLLLEMLFCGEETGAWTKFRCSRRGVEKSHPGPVVHPSTLTRMKVVVFTFLVLAAPTTKGKVLIEGKL